MVLVSISDVLDVAGNFKRPLVEGERILDSGLLVAVGKLGASERNILKIWALCLQTSALFEKPHVIEVKLNLASIYKRVKAITCTCKAGTSEKCKHCVATLMYLNKINSENDLEDLSCTDLEQQWGKLRSAVQSDYEAVPITQYCHAIQPPPIYASGLCTISKQQCSDFAKSIVATAPKSEAFIHYCESRAAASAINCQNIDEEAEIARKAEVATLVTEKLLEREPSPCLKKLINLVEAKEKQLPSELADFYETLKRTKERCILIAAGTCNQTEELWFTERSFKVSGSKIYGLYTYTKNKNPDWDSKLNSVFNSSFHGNDWTLYGLECEPTAREKYAAYMDVNVVENGLFSRPELPMLGYSADGVVVDKDFNPIRLYEVKSLEKGKTIPAAQLSSVAACCNKKTKRLKTKHMYYGQIQLGMLLLGLSECDFMLHSSVENDNTIALERVAFDESFTFRMVSSIIQLYFDRILPWLYTNQKAKPSQDEV